MPLKPILPFAGDFIAHAFNEFDHVATVHFENGEYHVHAEVVKDAKSKNSDQEAPVNETNLKTDLHCAPEIITSLSQHPIITHELTAKIAVHPHTFFNGRSVSPNYPPPQVS
ncbi:MAG: hypothetical protein A3D31_01355 [Candidatus Fluviicola riflensis]|nr:MAG: hypothetical protein CHH17_04185 [Candidatus Fluviicola riflensis]OGS76251.1 MAG: hypothetical protein A3D31_01355 [Candidatus Fluviicola riflensis]OGS83205.1 MAG: hypothetical protein A2724_00485 [Fluviicola sp. RIFCSPHIGHO2_01_FULL_43_53]OGS83783.1 MAG: hypothetical protein A3E30_17960 [Fluviicola sp. RIFCSPHIGHO2_12_FULL_43_24]